jgi:acyl carrier protein
MGSSAGIVDEHRKIDSNGGFHFRKRPPDPRSIHVSDSEISEKVKDIVSDKLDVPREEVEESKNFVNDLKADSLALVELGMAFEDNFGISIPDEDYEKLKTVGDAIAYVKKARG